MRFYLDSAAADDIREAAAWPWVAGVTTNPAILERAGLRSIEPVLAAVVASGRRDWTVWAQLPDGAAGDTARAAFALRERLADLTGGFFAGPTLVVKLLPRAAHLWAAARLAADGVAVCVTGITNPVQALAVVTLPRLDEGWEGGHATEGPPGSRNPNVPDWIAAYVGRLVDAGRDGVSLVAGMAAAYRAVGARTRVLAGSVRDAATLAALAAQVGGGRGAGLDVTLGLDLLRGALDDPVTAVALAQFADHEAHMGS